MVLAVKIARLKLPQHFDGLAAVARHGGGTSGSKERIYDFYMQNSGLKERISFVKKECQNYGYGSPTKKPCYLRGVDFFGSKITYEYFDEIGRLRQCEATWKQLAQKIGELIQSNTYMTGGR